MVGGLINHLWQSTLFGLVAASLTIVFWNNRAGIRFWLWLTASFKFLLPFSLLMSLGSQLCWSPAAQKIAGPGVSSTMVQISRPFPDALRLAPSTRGHRDLAAIAIFCVWACGFSGVALMRFRGWLRIRAARRASAPMDIPLTVEVLSSPGLLEPGVVGLFHPILLLPADIMQRLTPRQLEAVLAHELCHIRRCDNLTSAIHMVVEALFWFHPLVWWIGAHLVDERERACDEEVLSIGNAPDEYAEGILNVCKSYLESPLRCVSGVSGSNLKKRVQVILAGGVAGEVSFAKKVTLVVAGIVALAAPIMVGVMSPAFVQAQSQPQASGIPIAKPSGGSTHRAPAGQRSAPPKPERAPAYVSALGSVAAYTVAVKPRVDGQLMALAFKEGDRVEAGQVLASIEPRPHEIQLAHAEGQLARDEAQLGDAQNALPKQPLTIAQLEGSIKVDRANVDNAKLQLTYAQVTAPISGVVGLRLVDPGNIVHASDITGIVSITQSQPIAVLFNIPDDSLPEVLARLREGASVPVEAWSRDYSRKIAIGRLTAVDNQIDQTTGTAKLKAVFDNKDGALFPNQFVNIRLFLNSR